MPTGINSGVWTWKCGSVSREARARLCRASTCHHNTKTKITNTLTETTSTPPVKPLTPQTREQSSKKRMQSTPNRKNSRINWMHKRTQKITSTESAKQHTYLKFKRHCYRSLPSCLKNKQQAEKASRLLNYRSNNNIRKMNKLPGQGSPLNIVK